VQWLHDCPYIVVNLVRQVNHDHQPIIAKTVVDLVCYVNPDHQLLFGNCFARLAFACVACVVSAALARLALLMRLGPHLLVF
jgi:hypothetical protein